MSNQELINAFTEQADAKPSTLRDYVAKLNQCKDLIEFSANQKDLIQFFSAIENPNTRSAKCFAVMRLRRQFDFPTNELEEYREEMKKEIQQHRKKKAGENNENLISYEELLGHLDGMKGRDYYMNHMYCHHGLRNMDINCKYVSKKPKEVNENMIYFNPRSKAPKVTLYICDYKTKEIYDMKLIESSDPRLFAELK